MDDATIRERLMTGKRKTVNDPEETAKALDTFSQTLRRIRKQLAPFKTSPILTILRSPFERLRKWIAKSWLSRTLLGSFQEDDEKVNQRLADHHRKADLLEWRTSTSVLRVTPKTPPRLTAPTAERSASILVSSPAAPPFSRLRSSCSPLV